MAKQSREMMERQLLHLVRLIDDLLDISRISLGRLELKKARVTVKEVVDTALEVSSPFIGANHQTLVVEIPPEEIHLFGDLTRLAQVISNLLNNSAKYSQAGARIELRVSRLGQTVLFQVIDTGLGIPSSMIERIFDMFGQVDTTLDRAQGGLGIGLALVRQLVELHNGTVKAESPGEGQGSTFTVALPIELEPPSLATGTPKTIEPLLSMPRKILIVDDNQDAADSLAMYLRTEGHCVRVAYKPSVALEMVSQFKPEMVVLDIGLPEMSGYEVARAIRAEPALSKVILVALTGWGGEKDKENAKNAGFDAHLTKPVDPAAVQNILSGYFPPVG
jgi:CheY-like chemotaxis protein/anti-sigma regulatory factor (Ser/Thr protein kinase)